MTAQCWWCQVGIAKIHPNAAPDPLGCCFDCCVFACGGHAELERYRGKWLCLQSAAQAVAAGAGVTTPDDGDLVIESSAEFESRLPAIAQATEDDRAFFYAGPAEGWLYALPERLHTERDIRIHDPRLLADALGIGRFIEAGLFDWDDQERSVDQMLLLRPLDSHHAAGPRRRTVIPGLLGELLSEAPR